MLASSSRCGGGGATVGREKARLFALQSVDVGDRDATSSDSMSGEDRDKGNRRDWFSGVRGPEAGHGRTN